MPPKSKKKKTKPSIVAQAASVIVASVADAKSASAIVTHVLTHFGAGYGAQRQTENPAGSPANLQIYRKVSDLSGFHHLLLESTLKNFAAINWETNNPLRDQICKAAFAHGMAARQRVVADGTTTLSLSQILATLPAIQAAMCAGSGGAGGGPVCDF